jgi:hypothetical protein
MGNSFAPGVSVDILNHPNLPKRKLAANSPRFSEILIVMRIFENAEQRTKDDVVDI